MKMLLSFIFINYFSCQLVAAMREAHWEEESLGQTQENQINDEQYKSLLLQHVFQTGIPSSEGQENDSYKVPYVMDKLYRLLVDADTGQMKSSAPFDVDFIHGLEDHYETQRRMQFWFDTSVINRTEDIIDCYFHVYKRRPTRLTSGSPHAIKVQLYKVTDPEKLHYGNGLTEGVELIEQIQVSAYTEDWIVFKNLKDVIKQWIRHPAKNHGLLLAATDREHNHVNGTHIDFIQRGEPPLNKQPMFVVYTDKERKKGNKHKRKHRSNIQYLVDNFLNESPMSDVTRSYECSDASDISCIEKLLRKRRSVIYTDRDKINNEIYGSESREPKRRLRHRDKSRLSETAAKSFQSPQTDHFCRIRPLYISFQALGWNKWIVAPKGLNANFCDGTCPFPLTSSLTLSNHAVLQSMSNYYHPDKVKAPCCVPKTLAKMSILYYQSKKTITMKNYDDMIVQGCGCQ